MTDPANPVAGESPNALATPQEVVRVVFTYDDGPFARRDAEGPYGTASVLAALEGTAVKVCFFVQWVHLRSTTIADLLVKVHEAKHLIAIHGGSLEWEEGVKDHHLHPARARDTAPGPRSGETWPDGSINGLHADLLRARARIKELVGYEPEFVRAPEGRTSSMEPPYSSTNAIYSRLQMSQILWNVDSKDSHGIEGYGPTKAKDFLREQASAALLAPAGDPTWDEAKYNPLKGPPRVSTRTTRAAYVRDQYPRGPRSDLVVLFHDHNRFSVRNVAAYMETLRTHLAEQGKVARFTESADEIRDVFLKRAPWDVYAHPWHNLADSEPPAAETE